MAAEATEPDPSLQAMERQFPIWALLCELTPSARLGECLEIDGATYPLAAADSVDNAPPPLLTKARPA